MAEYQERFAAIKTFIQQMVEGGKPPSLALAVAQHGEILWEEGFGWADREGHVAATAETIYSLASISKPITASACMALHQRGLLDIDRPANDYLGDTLLTARVGTGQASLRQLLSHTSGLGPHCQFFYADEAHARPPIEESIRRYGNLVFAPGERFFYANLGYGVVGHVLSRVAGKSFAEVLRDEVFLPLGMGRAALDDEPGRGLPEATRYGADGLPYPWHDSDAPGAGAITCSAHDLLRFGLLHVKSLLPDQRARLDDQSIDAMQRPDARCGAGNDYGLGWLIQSDYLGYRAVSHDGGMGGVATQLLLIPQEQLVVAVLANTVSRLPFQVADELVAALLPPAVEQLAQRQQRSWQLQSWQQQVLPNATAPWQPRPELLGQWQGRVVTEQGSEALTLWFNAGGEMHARLGKGLRALLNNARLSDGLFEAEMLGRLDTADSGRRPHRLRLALTPRGERLNGALITLTDVDFWKDGGAPSRRVGNALSHWVELTRIAHSDQVERWKRDRLALADRPRLAPAELARLETPVGEQLWRLLEAINSGEPDRVRAFLVEHCPPASPQDLELRTNWFIYDFYAYTQGLVLDSIEHAGDYTLAALAQARHTGSWYRLTLEVATEPPYLLIKEDTRFFGTLATPGRRVRLSAGALACYVEGSGGPSVLFEAGSGCSSQHWGRVPAAVARDTTVFSYDRAGLGASDNLAQPRSFHHTVEELHDLLEQLDLPRPYIFVGHSSGGLLARLFVERYADEVAGVVLVDSNHEGMTERLLAALPPEQPDESTTLQNYRRLQQSLIFGPEWADWPACMAQIKDCATLGDRPLSVLSAAWEGGGREVLPAEITAQEAAIWEQLQRELAQLSSCGRQIVVPESGHMIQLDQPDVVIRAIQEVLAQVRRAGANAPG